MEGYTIIKWEQIGKVIVVLGHKPDTLLTPFVIWKAHEHHKFKFDPCAFPVILKMEIVGLPYIVRTILGLNAQYYNAAESSLAIATILGSIVAGLLTEKLKVHKVSLILASLNGIKNSFRILYRNYIPPRVLSAAGGKRIGPYRRPAIPYTPADFDALSKRLQKAEHELEVIRLSKYIAEVPLRKKLSTFFKQTLIRYGSVISPISESMGIGSIFV